MLVSSVVLHSSIVVGVAIVQVVVVVEFVIVVETVVVESVVVASSGTLLVGWGVAMLLVPSVVSVTTEPVTVSEEVDIRVVELHLFGTFMNTISTFAV